MKDHQVTIRTIIDVAQGKTINIVLIIKFRIRELHVQKCTRLEQSAFKHQKARNSNWPLMFHGVLNKIVTLNVLCKHDPENFPPRLNNPQYVDYKYSSILDDKRYLTSVQAQAEIFLMEIPLFVCFWGISILLRSNSATFQDYAVLFGSTWVTSQISCCHGSYDISCESEIVAWAEVFSANLPGHQKRILRTGMY